MPSLALKVKLSRPVVVGRRGVGQVRRRAAERAVRRVGDDRVGQRIAVDIRAGQRDRLGVSSSVRDRLAGRPPARR